MKKIDKHNKVAFYIGDLTPDNKKYVLSLLNNAFNENCSMFTPAAQWIYTQFGPRYILAVRGMDFRRGSELFTWARYTVIKLTP